MIGNKSWRWTATAVLLIVSLAVPWAVWADNLIPDGDYATPVDPNALALGDICQGESKSGYALFAINRVGGGQTFANNADVSVSVKTPLPANVSASMTDNSITLPSNWVSLDNNIQTDNPDLQLTNPTAASAVTVNTAGLSLGTYSKTVNYEASGAKDGGGTVTRPGNLQVTFRVVECQANQPPSVTADDDPVTVNEGDTATNTGTVSDPDGDVVTLTASVGTIVKNDGTWSWSFATTDGPEDSQTVTITATDSHGASSSVQFALVVNNVAPSVAADTDPVVVDEGQTATNTGTYSDPGADTIALWASVGTITDNGDGTWSWSFATTDGPDESQVVTIRATDSDSAYSETTFQLTVKNVAPSVAADNATVTVDEGQTATNTGTWSDPGADVVTLSASVGTVTKNADGTWSWSFATTDGPNDSQTVKITATDSDGASSEATFALTVNNVAPTATFNYPKTDVNEGSSFTLSLTDAYDPSSADTTAGFKYAFDCGDGYGDWGDSNSATCSTCDDAELTVKGKIKDKDGGVTEYTGRVTVVNVAPTITSVTAPIDPVNIADQPINVSVAFSDPGTCDAHTVVFDWGDGDSTTVDSATSPASASHTYAGAGVYTIKITVTDDDGGVGEASVMVVVYDPGAGFVTGGGWIMSPAGAYTADPALSGKATFGFVSKYLKGAKVPTGNTEFQFHAAGFNFKSTAYEWLVVSGTQAQYKGTGTVNGVEGYGFLLTAGDSTPDTFRLKVWDSSGTIVYDNGSNQPIASGSIIIHTAKK